MSRRVAIIGAGKVGTALGRLLTGAGYALVGVASRSLESARRACASVGSGRAVSDGAELARAGADLVFITTPDDAIRSVCDALAAANALRPETVVAHCSGALSSAVLADARRAGAHVGSLHPLQSFATVEEAVRLLPGCFCAIEGDVEAVNVLDRAARDLGCRPFTISPEGKALYHASAVVASNYLVALQSAAVRLAAAAGLPRQEALSALLPLVKGTVSNLERVGLPHCLTGPIARGDVATVRLHCEEIGRKAPDLLDLYRLLGREAVAVALAKGSIGREAADELMLLLR